MEYRSMKHRVILVKLILLLIMMAHPLFYFTMYSGDAEIHLVYAKNAAAGHFFEFNFGEKSAGVTSPGYMMLLSGMFELFPETYVPLIVKLMNILAWYAFLVAVFILSKKLIGNSRWAWVSTLIVALMPGTVYNATLGMENGIFGAILLIWFLLVIRWNWFSDSGAQPSRELTLGLLLGILCWIRPEGFILAAIALLFRFVVLLRIESVSPRSILVSVRRVLVVIAPVVLLCSLYFYFHYSQIGSLLPTSGMSRIMAGGQGSLQLGSLIVNPKFTKFLAYYFPVSAFMIVGIYLLFSRRIRLHVSSRYYVFLAVILALFFALYSTILGAHHLSRYIIFLIPIISIFSIMGAKWIAENWRVSRKWKVARGSSLSVVLCVLFSGEIYARYHSGSNYPVGELWEVMEAPDDRYEFSDELYEALGRPSKQPISLAYQEVQIRYWLDERFTVRSLDGRVDALLLDFVDEQGNYDHIGYIEARDIDYLMEIPNYNRDVNVWSLSDLSRLEQGESEHCGSVVFTRAVQGFRVDLQSTAYSSHD
jgi:hypothetical protein